MIRKVTTTVGRPAPAMDDTPVSLLQRLRGPTDQAAWARFTHLYTPLLYH